jgi:hypothetical protein
VPIQQSPFPPGGGGLQQPAVSTNCRTYIELFCRPVRSWTICVQLRGTSQLSPDCYSRCRAGRGGAQLTSPEPLLVSKSKGVCAGCYNSRPRIPSRRESQLTILQPTAASNWRFQRRAMTLRIYPPPFRTASFPIHSSPTSKPALARLTGGVPADTVITESHARKTDSRCKLRGTACSVPHSPSSPWRAPISKGCSIPHHEVHSVISGRRHNISKKISSWKKKPFFLESFFP